MAYATNDIITWAKISQPLAAKGSAKDEATIGRSIDINHDVKLYLVRKSVEWYNSQGTVDADILYLISNYLFALEGAWGAEAQFIDGGSGGIVAPVSPSSTAPTPYYFYIPNTATSTAPIAAGQTSITLPATWAGRNIVFARGGIVQTTIVTEPTYFTWNSATRAFTCFPAAVLDELFSIIPT